MRHERGFTLIELVLVVTVIGILSLSAIPAFNDNGASRADAAARKLVSDISYARKLARTRNGVYGVNLDVNTETYTVHSFNPATGVETPVTDPLTLTPMAVAISQIPGLGGIDIQSANFGGNSIIRFTSQGFPQTSAGAALAAAGTIVVSRAGVTRTVFVQPNTGEVTYQ